MRFKRKSLLLTFMGLVLVFVGWELLQDQYSSEERQIRQAVRETLLRHYPEQARQVEVKYGLQAYNFDGGVNLQLDQVILVHGLDDPGRVWMNLAPMLQSLGYAVWLFRYPDDQPIAESARLFHTELARVRAEGIETVAIVAHSMGGLVSREMLTGIERQDNLPLPRVGQLIMVGTPNHGSDFARFRALAELRDQTTELLAGKGHWLGWILDGAGEAGIDLIPDSEFLVELNSRPYPVDTQMTVIAAVLSKVEKGRLEAILTEYREGMPAAANSALGDLAEFLEQLIQQLGDGVVTVQSTRLDGADHFIVEGTHLSMIRNLLESSERVPPAIPIIVEQLKPH